MPSKVDVAVCPGPLLGPVIVGSVVNYPGYLVFDLNIEPDYLFPCTLDVEM